MPALLSTSNTSAMSSPITTCSVLDFTTSTKNKTSPVRVMDFPTSDTAKKTATVVIPKYLLPSLTDNSLRSALIKGVALTNNNMDETATFSCTDDSSVTLSSISSEDGSTATCSSSCSKRRAIFSPYWKKSGEQPLEMIPTGEPDEEAVAAIPSPASCSVISCPYDEEIRELRRVQAKPRLVRSDPGLVRPLPPSRMPPSILRRSKYSRNRSHTTMVTTNSDLDATSKAVLGALATIQLQEEESHRVKFDTKVDVRVFTKERPMLEQAEPGWSKMFTD